MSAAIAFPDLRSAALREGHAYWQAKKGDRLFPSRADFDPMMEAPKLSRQLILLDVQDDPLDFRYRLVGSFVSEYFLDDGTGRTVSDVFGQNDYLRKGALWVFRKTCTGKEPIRLRSPSGELGGRHYPNNDALYLPLSADGQSADMVMNIFTFNYEEYKKTQSVRSLTNIH